MASIQGYNKAYKSTTIRWWKDTKNMIELVWTGLKYVIYINGEYHRDLIPPGSQVVIDEVPTEALKFDQSYWATEANALSLYDGDITLSLNESVDNLIGQTNNFDIVADGVHRINLSSDFKSNGISPLDLNGKILDPGSYVVYCTYSPDGITISIPKALENIVSGEGIGYWAIGSDFIVS